MAFAEHTTIAIAGGSSQIESLREGDTVLAAGVDLQWQARTLRFVAGAGSGVTAIWDIATSMDKPHRDFPGHLLNANGVVAGDFDLQTSPPPPTTTRG